MNASKRWEYHFLKQMECVNCRKKRPIALYFFDGPAVDVENRSLQNLEGNLSYMDTWCSDCKPQVTRKVTSVGRENAKHEAARVASIKAASTIPAYYDTYVLWQGCEMTKSELLEKVKSHVPCEVCGQVDQSAKFIHVRKPKVMNIPRIPTSSMTIHQMIKEIEKTILVCGECYQEGIELSTAHPIELDENFWRAVCR